MRTLFDCYPTGELRREHGCGGWGYATRMLKWMAFYRKKPMDNCTEHLVACTEACKLLEMMNCLQARLYQHLKNYDGATRHSEPCYGRIARQIYCLYHACANHHIGENAYSRKTIARWLLCTRKSYKILLFLILTIAWSSGCCQLLSSEPDLGCV